MHQIWLNPSRTYAMRRAVISGSRTIELISFDIRRRSKFVIRCNLRRYLYELNDSFENKIQTIARKMYCAVGVEFPEQVLEKLRKYEEKVIRLLFFFFDIC